MTERDHTTASFLLVGWVVTGILLLSGVLIRLTL
jgi:hypothetical protein